MAASDHINEYVTSYHTPIKMYHASFHKTPPHSGPVPKDYEGYENSTPSTFHVGTEDTIENLRGKSGRQWVHEYEIHPSGIHPVTYGDSPSLHNTESRLNLMGYLEAREVSQQELFEAAPLTKEVIRNTKSVVPYRNMVEDVGSISYVVPKAQVGKTVKYLGVRERKPD